MSRDSDRMLGVFGKREMELAALVILNKGLLHQAITIADFPDDGTIPTSMYVVGFRQLVNRGYLFPVEGIGRFRVTDEFVDMVRHEL